MRKILGDSPKDHRYIATVAGRGYQFVAPVIEGNGAALPEPGRSKSRKQVIGFGAVAVALALGAAAWFILRRPDKPVPELKQTRLTFNSTSNAVSSDALSSDDQYLAYSDPAGIHIKMISSGEERLIPRPSTVPADAQWGVFCCFPDNTQVLALSNVDGNVTIWAVSVLGRSIRKLRDNAAPWTVSPDGAQIAFSPGDPSGNSREIWFVDRQGENPRRVLSVNESEWLWCVRWSPDGQRLAYIRARNTPELSQWIETCDLKGEKRTTVLTVESQSGRWVQDIFWLSNGHMIYSQMDSPGSNDGNLWQIGIDTRTGTPTSKPERVTQWAGAAIFGLSASANGNRLAFLKATARAQVYLGELKAGGTQMRPPRPLTDDEANDSPSAWTADSKAVIFLSDRVNKWGIFKQQINQETAELVVSGSQYAWLPRLSSDGAWVLRGPSTPTHLMRVSVNGGAPQKVLETRVGFDWHCSQPPAIRCVIFELNKDNRQILLTEFDLLKGRGKVLRTIQVSPGPYNYSDGLSPDGSTFAIAGMSGVLNRIRLFSLVGGPDREITVKSWTNISCLDWSADGKVSIAGPLPLRTARFYMWISMGTQRCSGDQGKWRRVARLRVYLHRMAAILRFGPKFLMTMPG